MFFNVFGTCHQACLIDGNIMGDPMDVEMLSFSQFSMALSDDPKI